MTSVKVSVDEFNYPKQRTDDELERFYHDIWNEKYIHYLDCKKNNRPYNQDKSYNCHC